MSWQLLVCSGSIATNVFGYGLAAPIINSLRLNYTCCCALCFPHTSTYKKKDSSFLIIISEMMHIFESSNNKEMTNAQQTLDFLSWTLPSKLTTLESTERAYEAINEAISEHGELKMFVNRKNLVMKKLMDLRIEKRKLAAQ